MKEQFYLKHIVGVIGKDVSSNPSVAVYNAGFASIGLDDWHCITLPVLDGCLEGATQGLKAFVTMRGLNCFAPYTIEIMKYLDVVSDSAKLHGAANVITDFGNYTVGDNTDGEAFMMSLKADAIDVRGRKVVVLGAGGTARAICVELGLAGVAGITVVNRSRARAEELLALLRENTDVAASYAEWNGTYTVPEETDIVINATPVGLYPKADDMPDVALDSIGQTMFVQDIIPCPLETALIRVMRRRGVSCATGGKMLVNQAALNIKKWSGMEPNITAMYDALEKASS